jgi:hypothetical protein
MNFKKKALVSVVAAASMTGVAVSQAGTFNANAGITGGRIFASELFGTGSTIAITPAPALYKLGAAGIAAGTQVVDFTVTGGTWAAAPALTVQTNVDGNATATGAATVQLVAGGATTDSTAQFRMTTTAALEGASDTLTLTYTLDETTALATPTTTGGPTLAMTITDVLGSVDTAGAATIVASSAENITIAGSAATVDSIDVTNNSTLFVSGAGATSTTQDLGTFTITDVAAPRENDNSGALAFAAGNANATDVNTVTITGLFDAALAYSTSDSTANGSDGVTTTFDGVTLSGCIAADATTLTATTATFVLTEANVDSTLGNACTINMFVDGETAIQEMTPTVAVAIDYSVTGVTDEAYTANLGTVSKNGATAAANLLLNPTGAYDNFVRVTNGGGVAGNVFVTMFNDSGDSVAFTLAAGPIAAGASTDLISVETLYAEAQTADATFDVGTGKLRANFTGEFDPINVQNISTSTDGTTFFTF